MREFKVALKQMPADANTLFITADDFNTEQASDDHYVYFNFWVQPEGEDAISVAAVPFENVLYIVTERVTKQPKP